MPVNQEAEFNNKVATAANNEAAANAANLVDELNPAGFSPTDDMVRGGSPFESQLANLSDTPSGREEYLESIKYMEKADEDIADSLFGNLDDLTSLSNYDDDLGENIDNMTELATRATDEGNLGLYAGLENSIGLAEGYKDQLDRNISIKQQKPSNIA